MEHHNKGKQIHHIYTKQFREYIYCQNIRMFTFHKAKQIST